MGKGKGHHCTPCELSAALGVAFGVCETALKKEVDCKSLENQLIEGKIQKRTVFRTLYKAAEGKKGVQKDIKTAAKFIHIKI